MIAKEKVLFIEDKKSRFDRQSPAGLTDYATIVTDLPGYDVDKKYDFSLLDNYKLIILHNSILSDKDLSNGFTQYVQKSNSFFILFSGSFSVSQFLYDRKVLKMPVNLFYSNDLIKKLQELNEDEDFILLHFLYGAGFYKAIEHNIKQLKWLYPNGLPEDIAKHLEGNIVSTKQTKKEGKQQLNVETNDVKHQAKVLVLQNNTLPNFTEEDNKIFKDKNIDIENVNLKPDDPTEDYDFFLSEFLGEYVFSGNVYDLVVMPISFDRNNSLTCEGIRVACHIRLTQEWNNTRTPILFFSPDSLAELISFAPYPSIFATSHISLSNTNDIPTMIQEMLFAIQKNKMTDDEYNDFLRKVRIEHPTNYKTHHSIANEWTLMQWSNMIDWHGDAPSINNAKFMSRLHTKYMLQTLNCHSENYRNEDKLPKKIEGIGGKRIMLVDDEYDKGWESMLNKIINSSGADLVCFHEFDKTLNREEQVAKINNYIDQYPDFIDCYLIDLRLHDDDVEETESSNLSGHRVSNHIINDNLNGNRGRQVVILTASNKVWNMRKELDDNGARYYALKESPEMQLTYNQSKNLYLDFCKDLVNACQQSYIAKYQKFIDDNSPRINSYIDVLVSLLISDRSIDKKQFIPSMLLAEVATIEKYVVDHYEFSGTYMAHKGGANIRDLNHKIMFEKDGMTPSNSIDVRFPTGVAVESGNWKFAPTLKNSSLTLIIAYLYYDLNCNHNVCKLFLTARKERNTHIAHNGGAVIKLSITEVRRIFEEIIMKIQW